MSAPPAPSSSDPRRVSADALEAESRDLLHRGQPAAALERLERAAQLDPHRPEIANGRGVAHAALGAHARAAACFREALALRPIYAEAQFHLGNALLALGRNAEAEAAFQAALRDGPATANVCNGRGVALLRLGRPAEALPCFRASLQLRPDQAVTLQNLSVALLETNQLAAALDARRAVVRLQPHDVEARVNLGLGLADTGDLTAARNVLREAIGRGPNAVSAEVALALTELRAGDFDAGWRRYEGRFRMPGASLPVYPQPRWDGGPAAGRTLLLHAEQGIGDTLQFLRYARLLDGQGWRVVAVVPGELVSLLRRTAGLAEVAGRGRPLPAFDVWAPLLSLPFLCGTRLETIPSGAPYLTADPERVARWRAEPGPGGDGLRVGIAWQGSPHHRRDQHRSVPLTRFLSLARVPGVRLISLQHGPGREQLTPEMQAQGVLDLGPKLDRDGAALEDTAAVMRCLDLVITVDTSLAHLAGALGTPVWVAVSFAADWRWLTERDDSPWYPTLRLFRQQTRGDWDGVFARLAAALRERASGQHPETVGAAESVPPVAAAPTGADPTAPPDDPEASADHWRRVVAQRPRDAAARFHLGHALLREGQAAAAEDAFRQALQWGPPTANVCNGLGVSLLRLGRLDEAAEALQQAVQLRPEHVVALGNLGTVQLRLKRPREAAEVFRTLLRLRPQDGAPLRNQLGAALVEQGLLDEAEAVFRQALEREPDRAETLNNLGHALCQGQRFAEAEPVLRRALAAAPQMPEAHSNLATVLSARLAWDEAVACMQEAVRLRPREAGRYNNLANVLVKAGRYADADAAYAEAERLQPDYAIGRKNRGLAQLAAGDFARGWENYEWRFRTGESQPPPYRQPRWDGGSLEGRVLLLQTEQGHGDTFQFWRYLAEVKRRCGGTVLMGCPPRLHPFLTTQPGPDRVVPGGAVLPHFDVHAPLMSLPWLLRTTSLADVPVAVPYLFADPQRVARWRERLAGTEGFRVGVHWQGSPTFIDDRYRSFPLRHFAPLARIAGVRLISLQRGHGSAQLAEVAAAWPVADLGPEVDAEGAFTDTAAVLQCLDLVVTSDSAVAHLAGALGVPVWVALGREPDWRWLREREDSPWYPSMRLFRQRTWGDWDEVFTRIASALRERAGAAAAGGPSRVLGSAKAEFRLPDPAADVPEGAVARREEARTQDPERGELPQGPGRAGAGGGDHRAALEQRRRAVQLRPRDAEAQFDLGQTCLQSGLLAEAEVAFRTALREGPATPNSCHGLGLALLRQGRPEEATEQFRAALRGRPDHVEARQCLGIAHLRLGRAREAVECLRAAQAQAPDGGGPSLRSHLAAALVECQAFDEGEAMYREALRLRPGSAELLNNLGNLLLRRGEWTEAEALLRQAATAAPDLEAAQHNWARARKAVQREPAARAAPAEPAQTNGPARRVSASAPSPGSILVPLSRGEWVDRLVRHAVTEAAAQETRTIDREPAPAFLTLLRAEGFSGDAAFHECVAALWAAHVALVQATAALRRDEPAGEAGAAWRAAARALVLAQDQRTNEIARLNACAGGREPGTNGRAAAP